jgi:2-polyprenyl-3-methyl-5-hydroxy-6-metoxy-1,4-benzoquinol methylase
MKAFEKKSKSAQYWEKHILSWEASAYYKEGLAGAGWWDRLSILFRGDAMYERMYHAIEVLAPHIQNKTVLDVGCASGRFPFQLAQTGAAKVYGVDISSDAIEIAKVRARELGLDNRLEFSVADVVRVNSPLPHADLVTALGVIEYFDRKDLTNFLGICRQAIFFSIFPTSIAKKNSPHGCFGKSTSK